ncbi:hypothetical protein K0M31_016371 [Melipona bicolor]|uniref:phospholipase A1 n=1 Tax=Melipona bicolor TaxID=60889 RepID=A0AA40G7A1_9HYME|nr:hypothetical protein K0M31_016371 [Melipona bicolor]
MVNASLVLLYPTLLSVLSQSNYMIFPNEEGVPHLVLLDETELSAEEVNTLSTDLDTITFTLFTRYNPKKGQLLKLNDVNSIRNSDWDAKKPTIIVTHGWNSAGSSESCTLVRNAFIEVWNSNVIVVDWSKIADNVVYSSVAKSVPSVADHVAAFVNFLRSNGLKTTNLKIVGHSLGAHIAGLSARKVGNVAEVIALDPAKPMFEKKGPGGRVDKTDAQNVQAVHTCPGLLGLDISIGTSDFFANDGRHQPGCANDMFGSCAHGRSYQYYSESVTNSKGFLGTANNGAQAYMGGPTLDPKAKGTYNFKTRSSPPFALG